jgi:beta-phosphoglucomutase-like phosphatase (HAD superfamily)
VIFDCDGVLVDSEPISNEVLASHLTAAGIMTSPGEALQRYRGKLLSEVVTDAEEWLGGSLSPGFIESFERARAIEFRRRLRPIEAAPATVGRSETRGSPCASPPRARSRRPNSRCTSPACAICSTLTRSSAPTPCPAASPTPDLFLHAAEKMGAAPEHCVVIEDTTIGATAGIAAGMVVLGYAPDGDADPIRAHKSSGRSPTCRQRLVCGRNAHHDRFQLRSQPKQASRRVAPAAANQRSAVTSAPR